MGLIPRNVAFLRGINVGGHGTVTMEKLRSLFVSAGLTDVSTFRASGNVLFRTDRSDLRPLAADLEIRLKSDLGLAARVILRSQDQLSELVSKDPFRRLRLGDAKPYVTFLVGPPRGPLKFPVVSDDGTVRLLEAVGSDVLCLGRRVGSRPGFPNPFVESTHGQLATTRNWSTVLGVQAALRATAGSTGGK